MIDQKELDDIASIPVFGPLWAESIENWLCIADAMRLAGAGLPSELPVARPTSLPARGNSGVITAKAA